MKRSICRDEPRRSFVRHWLGAHGRKGHGVHSPYLYAMCSTVFGRRLASVEWASGKLGCKWHRLLREAWGMLRFSEAGRLVVPRGWKRAEGVAGRVEEGRLLELIAGGGVRRGERVVAVLQVDEWVPLTETAWRELVGYLGEESWLVLVGIRENDDSWHRWCWLSQCTVFTVCIDRGSYGAAVYRAGMSRYSFGIR